MTYLVDTNIIIHIVKNSIFGTKFNEKYDLWIAATASASEAVLLTTDKDFEHLHNKFLSLTRIDPQEYIK